MIIQTSRRGLTEVNKTRLNCLSLFWHFLDVVWICVFTVVYLLGHCNESFKYSRYGASHGSVKTYLIGFILSVILTVIPFYMVIEGTASTSVLLATVVITAVVQILVHRCASCT